LYGVICKGNNVVADDFAEYEDAKLDNIVIVVESGKAGLSGTSTATYKIKLMRAQLGI
jgi:hypothetical protein